MTSVLDSIYTPIEIAHEEVWKRWNDPALRGMVKHFFGQEIPSFLTDRPKAILARHLATPNFETMRFFHLARAIGLEPFILEYQEDVFTPRSQEKYFLGKLYISDGKGKNGGAKLRTHKILDFNQYFGKRLVDIQTTCGESLPDFHHDMLSHFSFLRASVIDMSEWLAGHGKKASGFYLPFLSFFMCNGVLFENFMLKDEEEKFTTDVVVPNISALESTFGVKPLIVPICPLENEGEPHWKYYPCQVEEFMKGREESRHAAGELKMNGSKLHSEFPGK